ncbi:O-antigen ligase family protein [Sphingomonas abaci]|uniref:O-antigen ligase n=1 Tax=Sphingomonas abaci TaxID=237611 RepID=A0A7W7EVV7_9SPHN|nr:O-antigen ligase family protein [Sphingomonas abaci]MBB4615902.1 O-antigen ligase [Sphingomonas abaci]
MFSVIKSSIVIMVLTAAAMYLFASCVKPAWKPVGRASAKVTAFAFLGLSLGQIYVAFAALLVVAAGFIRNRAHAAGLIIFLIVTLPGIAFTAMAGSLQLVNISTESCVTLGALIAAFMWTKGKGTRYSLADVPAFAVMLVLAFISARDSSLTNVMRVTVQISLSLFLPYHIVKKSMNEADAVRSAVLFVVASALAISAVAIFESVKAWPMYQVFRNQFGIYGLANVKMRGGMLRAGGPLMNPPLSAALLALCFVTTFAARDLFKSPAKHRILLAIVAVGLFSVQSRTGWLGAVAGCMGVMLSRRGVTGMIAPVAALSLVFGGVYGLTLASERAANLLGFSVDAKNSSDYRDKLYDRGVELVRQHPAIGQPPSIVTAQMEDLRQGEGIIDFVNGYLGIALFSGLIGLALFAGGIVAQAFASYRARRVSRARGWGSLSDMGLGVAVCAGAMFPYIPTDGRVVLTMLLLFALSNAVASLPAVGRKNSARRPSAPPPRSTAEAVPAVA